MIQPTPPGAADPFAPYPPTAGDDRAERQSRWLPVFGTISVVVGVLGTCMQGAGAGMAIASDRLLKLGGMDVSPAPKVVQYVGGVQAAVLMLLGITLAVGAIMMLRRNPLGAKLVLFWAVARLTMVVIGLGAALVTLNAQVDWQVTMSSEIRESLRKNPEIREDQLPPIADRAAIEKKAIWWLAGASLAFAIWPFVMSIVMTRENVRRDVASWSRAT
jgi:hypothetical protein